jgi:hypothetical protein
MAHSGDIDLVMQGVDGDASRGLIAGKNSQNSVPPKLDDTGRSA